MNEGIRKIINFGLIFLAAILTVVFISMFTASYIINKDIGAVKESLQKINSLEEKINQLHNEVNKEKEQNQNTIKDLQAKLENLKTTLEKDVNTETGKDKEKPMVSALSGPSKKLSSWEFAFNEEIESSTLNIGNINLVLINKNKKSINNKAIKSIKYNKENYGLTILVDTGFFNCQSCRWELRFTDKIKDLAGNSLVPRVFPL